MKKSYAYLLILLGVLISLGGFYLSIKVAGSGCGTCGGESPIINFKLLILSFPLFPKISPYICRQLGCALPEIPIFVDLHLFSLMTTFCGIFFVLRKNKF